MKLMYCTSIAFSNKLANRVQVQSMAREFQKKLGDDFCLGVNYKNVDDASIKIICFNTNKSFRLAWRYLKFVKEKNISHIYCREVRLLFFIILFNKLFFRRNLKFSHEIHAIDGGIINKYAENILSGRADKLIFIADNLREIYLEKYIEGKEKTMVAPDGVDMEIFDLDLSMEEARKKVGLPADKKIIGYCGKFKTMGMDKGIGDIFKAVKILNDGNLIFAAIGGSEEEIKYYDKMAKDLRVRNQIIFKGLSPQSELALYQKAADALLMPFPYNRHYAFYMSPLKMFEYMASKRPIIASDLPSIREVLNKNNAIIVRPDDPADLAAGIRKISEDKKLSEKISGQAYKDAGEYTWEKRAGRILKFIVK